jgi:ArsR family transcriptional regulator, virulence genes transcriptional regulator
LSLRPNHARELSAKAAEVSRLLAAIANDRRIAIVSQLLAGERSVGHLAETVGLTQSALSQHLAKLRAAGVVATRRDSQAIYYRLASEAAGTIVKTLIDIRRPRPHGTSH